MAQGESVVKIRTRQIFSCAGQPAFQLIGRLSLGHPLFSGQCHKEIVEYVKAWKCPFCCAGDPPCPDAVERCEFYEKDVFGYTFGAH
jgi:hypothetical protein